MATWVPLGPRSVYSVQTVNDSAPSLGTDGVSVAQVPGYSLVLQCDSGQIVAAAAGGLLAYIWDPLSGYPLGQAGGAWSRVAAAMDLTIPASAVGQPRISWPWNSVAATIGRIAHIASGLSLTGGGITLFYACVGMQGEVN